MEATGVIVAALAALGPTIAGVAAYRQARSTRSDLQTNHGKRAGEYLEMLGSITSDVTGLRLEQAKRTRELLESVEANHRTHEQWYRELDGRLVSVERAVCPKPAKVSSRPKKDPDLTVPF